MDKPESIYEAGVGPHDSTRLALSHPQPYLHSIGSHSEVLSMSATDIPATVRRQVSSRDGHRCRWCGRTDAAVHLHHIDYRSAGGGHTPANLISLCYLHHQLVHSDKGHYSPLLKELLEQGPGVTGMQLERWKHDPDNVVAFRRPPIPGTRRGGFGGRTA